MVDPIGTKPVMSVGQRTIARAEMPVRPMATESAASAASGRGTTVASTLSSVAPTDPQRITMIRRAIEEGRFPLSPATIADRLIALRLDWTSNDKA